MDQTINDRCVMMCVSNVECSVFNLQLIIDFLFTCVVNNSSLKFWPASVDFPCDAASFCCVPLINSPSQVWHNLRLSSLYTNLIARSNLEMSTSALFRNRAGN